MSGRFTRKMYDGCAAEQTLKQSTDPLEIVLDVNKYVHCHNICKPAAEYPPNSALLVDVESSLWGIDKLSSNCDTAKHPFCGPNGCLLTKDPRIAPHITPYACERGRTGDNAVVTNNMPIPTSTGYKLPNANICGNQTNGYYSNQNNNGRQPSAPTVRNQQPSAPAIRNQQPNSYNRAPLSSNYSNQAPLSSNYCNQAPVTQNRNSIFSALANNIN